MDAVNGSGQQGRPETGDTVTFTYAGVVDPDLILSGWDGSATAVTVRFDDNTNDDVLTVRDPSDGSILAGLGQVAAERRLLRRHDALHRLPDDPQRQHGDHRPGHGLGYPHARSFGQGHGLDDAAGLGHRVRAPGLELLSLVLGSSEPVSRPIRGPMSSAATPTAADQQHAAPRRRRQTKPPVTRRSAIQLLVGVLIVGAIPIVSTVRILQANALRNEQARADSALSEQLQNGLRELGRLGDNASDDAHTTSRARRSSSGPSSPATPRRCAGSPGALPEWRSTSARGESQAATPGTGVQRSIWLTVNGVRAAKIVASVPLGPGRSARLTHDAPHGRGDRLVLAKRGRRARRRRLHDEGSESYGWAASTTAGCQRWCRTPTAPA